MQKVGELLERVRARRDDDARQVRLLLEPVVDLLREREPLVHRHGAARDVGELLAFGPDAPVEVRDGLDELVDRQASTGPIGNGTAGRKQEYAGVAARRGDAARRLRGGALGVDRGSRGTRPKDRREERREPAGGRPQHRKSGHNGADYTAFRGPPRPGQPSREVLRGLVRRRPVEGHQRGHPPGVRAT